MFSVRKEPKAPQSIVLHYFKKLKNQGFTGDIATDYASRITLATDNSIYQSIPQGILFPRSTEDVSLALTLAHQDKFSSLQFYPRGGGTGTNGQALGTGIVLDLSRYMSAVIDIDVQKRQAHVQAGLVKDALNAQLGAHGLFFAPDLSTSSWATIGGMVNTDAAGQGSLVYGKTSDHVKSITIVLADGTVIVIDDAPKDPQAIAIEADCRDVLKPVSAKIEQQWPRLTRFATGYDLYHAWQPENDWVDLRRLVCGSEGTLGIVTEVVLSLNEIPPTRVLVNVCYRSFDHALRHAPFILKSAALSIESQDEQLLVLAQKDHLWPKVAPLLGVALDQPVLGLNVVEFAGQAQQVQQDIEIFCQRLDQAKNDPEQGVSSYHVCHRIEDIERVYALRKKSVGLLGNLTGHAKPIAFVEDTAVPPEYLADYIFEFREILDRHHVQYGMFGHVDAGVLHVRPALNLIDSHEVDKLQAISDAVFDLVCKYKGVMWGEHGRGHRSAYGPDFFGDLWPIMCAIKTIFDPQAKLNPDKIALSNQKKGKLAEVKSTFKADFDKCVEAQARIVFEKAFSCNGNGLCFHYKPTEIMCPSMRVTGDRRHSPKGRAHLMREWLRLAASRGKSVVLLRSSSLFIKLLRKLCVIDRQDFSHQVYDAMSGCLGCKACATRCPVHIDVPEMKTRFLYFYHQRYLRSVADALIGRIEVLLPWLFMTRQLWNAVIPQTRWLSHWLGLVDIPLFSQTSVKQWAREQGIPMVKLAHLNAMSLEQKKRAIVLVQDGFTSFFQADLVCAWLNVIRKLGYEPLILDYFPVGKSRLVKGFIDEFRQEAGALARILSNIACTGIPILGLDPAMTLCFRDEYPRILGKHQCQFKVLLPQEWLVSVLPSSNRLQSADKKTYYLMVHCTEKSLLPEAITMWETVFKAIGLSLIPVQAGCCGMAGTFGHESKYQKQSKALYQLSWQETIKNIGFEQVLVTGYSCRSQVNRFNSGNIYHPIHILDQISSHFTL